MFGVEERAKEIRAEMDAMQDPLAGLSTEDLVTPEQIKSDPE